MLMFEATFVVQELLEVRIELVASWGAWSKGNNELGKTVLLEILLEVVDPVFAVNSFLLEIERVLNFNTISWTSFLQ